MLDTVRSHEEAAIALLDDGTRKNAYDLYVQAKVGMVPRILAAGLFLVADLCYGRAPSYRKFHAIETIARIPYQTWELAVYFRQTAYFFDEARAIELATRSSFSRLAQDNETMHVIVISQLMRTHQKFHSPTRSVALPFLLSLTYFFACSVLHLVSRRSTYELNFLFETKAFQEYEAFLVSHEVELKAKPMDSAFLKFYGRESANEYEFFSLVRNDELLHRNRSMEFTRSA